mgnify:CR=1 FL=1|tara:strand:+ start:7358 stop:10162 length:2805 start_codon:yes stop_codon:yes gene_type:complete
MDWNSLQQKWQRKWQDAKLGVAKVSSKPKFYMIFAYPGISGFLHVGHMRGFSYTDAICRFERLNGKEVLFPVGTHASGNQAIAFANKVKNKDEDWLSYLKNNGCPEDKINELDKPEKIIEYFNDVYVNEYWKKFGFLCDWDRFTCTTFPDYEKFIQWQFRKLKQADLLVQKPYFATACVVHGPVAVDASETDIAKGGNAEKNEYTLLKFKWKDNYLVAATLRPETIFGQTNLWVNPRAKYVRVEVAGENWIMSKEAAEKLKFQKDDVMLKEDVDPKDLIGTEALAPGINRNIMILPADFCDPNVGSGIVTCVPSDAPYDYVALRRLQKDSALCHEYDLNIDTIKSIELIPIIESKGYGLYPAQEIVNKLKISELNDPNLKDATQEIYKSGFHTGVMRDSCGKFAGKKVRDAKELMKAQLLEDGTADIFYDLSEEVICRCGEQVIVKRIDDQWFIRYSDTELTAKAKEHARGMKIYPKEYYENIPCVLDWFAERACARLGNWLGSKFPFDERWTIEPISDSTLYPVYYIVSKFVKNGSLKVDDLTEEFFDYVYLGKGEGRDEWKKVREEFLYFYPLDINLGGKEHKTVHFPVFLMNHVALLQKEHWPKGIFINWWITAEGGKISKSKGGAVPIADAVKKYGVDAMRLYYSHIGSPHVDVVWTHEIVSHYKQNLERIYNFIQELNLNDSKSSIDSWMQSRMHEDLKYVNRIMQEYELRELASIVYYSMYDNLRWYIRRGGSNKFVVGEYISVWSRMMNPITPHLSEELFNGQGLCSASNWPLADDQKISLEASAGEELVKTAMDGMRSVMKLAKIDKPTKFTLFVAEDWLYELFEILAREVKVTRNVGEIMKEVLSVEKFKMKGKDVSKMVQMVVKDASKLPNFVSKQGIELEVMTEAKEFLSKEFECVVEIVNADESSEMKAKSAVPGKVGILVE